MRIAYSITKATNAHSQYEVHINFPLQQLLHERASMLRYTYIGWLVSDKIHSIVKSLIISTVRHNKIRNRKRSWEW